MKTIWIAIGVGIAATLMVFVARQVWLAPPPNLNAPPGVTITALRTIWAWEAKALLWLSGVQGVDVKGAIDCYRVEYVAPGRTGRLSGLLALPRGRKPRALVSFQHGTSTSRNAVPSRLDATGLAAAIVMAGNGHALVAPDYPGLGVSTGPHPYYVREAVAPSIVALIEVAQSIETIRAAPVFLSGFSEGAWASLAALVQVESTGKTVSGAALVAGPYDLRNISVPAALKGEAPSHSLYLAYAAWGMANHYGQPLDSVLSPEYAALVSRIFGEGEPSAILAALPAQPRKMFAQAFLDAFDTNAEHWFLTAFSENSLNAVTPRTEVRMYYGSKDGDVSPEESVSAAREMRARGAQVSAIDVGPLAHEPSMLAAAPKILAWIEEVAAGPNP